MDDVAGDCVSPGAAMAAGKKRRAKQKTAEQCCGGF